MTNFHDISSTEQFQSLLSEDLSRVSLINFWAPWAPPCIQMNAVVVELAKKYPQILVLQVEAEDQADIAESFDIESVPAFIILQGHTLLARVSGADAESLTSAIATHAKSKQVAEPKSSTNSTPQQAMVSSPIQTTEQLEKHMKGLMNKSKIVLFMKGSPDHPQCGFSRKTVALLRDHNYEFTHFDILTDENVRAGLKKLNNWPTFPQVIVAGEFVGGLDIVTEMMENGEFSELAS